MLYIKHRYWILMLALFLGIIAFVGMSLSSAPINAAPSLSTYVSGIIGIDTIWDMGGSPYYVIGDVQVPEGITLTIEPGVVVQYTGAYEMLVKGRLVSSDN